MNTLRNFAKSVSTHIFAKFEYFAKVIIYSKSPDLYIRNLQLVKELKISRKCAKRQVKA